MVIKIQKFLSFEETTKTQFFFFFFFPEIEFADFFQYEQALLDWKMDVQASIGAAKLPDIIGRSYYRPRFTIVKSLFVYYFLQIFLFYYFLQL